MDVLILRDRKEPWKKCSLSPLRGNPEVRFVPYHPHHRLDAGHRILLHPGGEELTEADRGMGLFVVDCAWRRLPTLMRTVDGTLERRRVPEYLTAYPRKNKAMNDPPTGLASIEALYAAAFLLGEPRPEWLEGYHFAEEFLRANPTLRLSD
jgi:ribosome biogenesis protein Tsr3